MEAQEKLNTAVAKILSGTRAMAEEVLALAVRAAQYGDHGI